MDWPENEYVLHGTSMSLGSATAESDDYLGKLADLCRIIEPALVSDHLCWSGIAGVKLHDLRRQDRDYKVGDVLHLQEFDPRSGKYTGDKCDVEITFITNSQFPCAYSSAALDRDYSILSLKVLQ